MTEAADLLGEIAGCERQVRAAQAHQQRLIAQFAEAERGGRPAGGCEQTERAIAMEIAAALGVSLSTARSRVGDADTLTGRLSAALAALEAGRIGLFAARQIADATLAVDERMITREVATALVEEAAQLLPGQVRAAADARVDALDPGAAARRCEQARASRDVWHLPKPDGVASFGATLPAEQALACFHALDSHARGRRADGDDRSIAQIMCDTLVERVTGATRADAPSAVELQVVITDQALLGAVDQPATLAGHGAIPADVAVRLSAEAQAWVRRLLTDPVTGAVCDADARRRRFFAGAARDLVKIRDRRCRNPYATPRSATSTTAPSTRRVATPTQPTATPTASAATTSKTTVRSRSPEAPGPTARPTRIASPGPLRQGAPTTPSRHLRSATEQRPSIN